MNRFLWVATIALLLVGFTGTAFAQATDPAAAGGGESGGVKPPCHLTMVHYEALNSQIDDLRGRIGRLRADLEALGVIPPEGTEIEGVVGGFAGSAQQQQQQRHEELQAELREANRQLAVLVELQQRYRKPAPYAGWHWGVGVRGGIAMLTNDDDYHAGLVQAFGLARWAGNSHLGVEVTTGIGAWPTGDSAPLMLSGRAAGISTWENWGISLGPEVSFLATPLEGQEGGNVLTTVLLEGEFHQRGGFLAKVFTGPTLYSEMKRTSGWWSGLGLGYYY